MHRILLVLTLLGLIGWVSGPLGSQTRWERPQTGQPAPLTLDDLHTRGVVGKLGVPLGEVVELTATVIRGADLRMKAYEGLYLLRVEVIDDRDLPEPTLMTFTVRPLTDVELVTNAFDLYELRYEERPESLNSEQIKALEVGYVGAKVRMFAYETGEFEGVPPNLPEEVPVWQGGRFGFRTHLEILGQPVEKK